MKKTKLLSFVLAAAMLAIPLAGCSQDEGADGGKETIKTVSYTHLDVYKRQLLSRVLRKG